MQAACDGRFRLGVGPSHHWIIDSMLGLPYEQPAKLVADYLDVFDAMFDGPNPVDVENDHFRIHNPLDVTDLPVPVFLAALGPVMLRLAGERAAGTVLWMADERAIAEHVVPKITKAAADAGRPAPRVVAGVAVCLCASSEVTGAIERANDALGHAEYSPNYQRLLEAGSRPTTSATCRRSAPRPTSSAGCGRTWTPAPPTSRRGSCRWGATRTRSWRRRGARVSSWRRWRPSSRERERTRHGAICSGRRSPRWRSTPRRASATRTRSSTAVGASPSPSSSPTPAG